MRTRVPGIHFQRVRQELKSFLAVVGLVRNHAEMVPSVGLLRVEPECFL